MQSPPDETPDRCPSGEPAAPELSNHATARREWWLLAGVLLLAAGLRLIGITRTGVWLDEGHTIWLSRLPVVDILRHAWGVDNHPPLAALLWHAWGAISQNEIWLRLLAVLAGLATVAFAYAWGRFVNPTTALWAGLLTASHGIMCYYSQEIRPYPWYYLLTVMGLWQVERWRLQPERRSAQLWLGAIVGLTAWSQAAGPLLCSTVLLYALLRGPAFRRALAGLLPAAIVAVLIAIPSVISVVEKAAFQTQEKWWIDFPPSRTLIHYMWHRGAGTAWINHWVGVISERENLIFIGFALQRLVYLLWGGCLAVGLIAARTRGLTAALAVCGAWFFGWMLLISYMQMPMLILRAAMPVVICALLACAVGGAALTRYRRSVGLAVLVVWVAMQGGWWVREIYAGPAQRVTPRTLAEHFNQEFGPKDLVLVCPATFELPLFYYIEHNVQPQQHIHSDTTPLEFRDGRWRRLPRHTDDKDYTWMDDFADVLRERRAQGYTGDVWWFRLGGDEMPATGRWLRRVFDVLEHDYQMVEYKSLSHPIFGWRQVIRRYRLQSRLEPAQAPPAESSPSPE